MGSYAKLARLLLQLDLDCGGGIMPRVISAALRCMVGLASICGACSGEPSSAARPAASAGAERAPATANAVATAPELRYHMRASFWDAVQARDALIAGELAKAQRAAERLAKVDYERMLPADQKHWVARMQQSASELSMAANLDTAALELGRLALACGDCHDLHRKGEQSRTAPLPWHDPPESFDARMHRHQLGIAQLWDGLVLPSEHSWRSGTVTITLAPLTSPTATEGDAPVDAATGARIEAVRALAKQARTAASYEARGRVFGEIVARCADCHLYERPAK